MDGKGALGWDGMDLALPFWNFIVGERTGVDEEPPEIPQLFQVREIICLFRIYLFI